MTYLPSSIIAYKLWSNSLLIMPCYFGITKLYLFASINKWRFATCKPDPFVPSPWTLRAKTCRHLHAKCLLKMSFWHPSVEWCNYSLLPSQQLHKLSTTWWWEQMFLESSLLSTIQILMSQDEPLSFCTFPSMIFFTLKTHLVVMGVFPNGKSTNFQVWFLIIELYSCCMTFI